MPTDALRVLKDASAATRVDPCDSEVEGSFGAIMLSGGL